MDAISQVHDQVFEVLVMGVWLPMKKIFHSVHECCDVNAIWVIEPSGDPWFVTVELAVLIKDYSVRYFVEEFHNFGH